MMPRKNAGTTRGRPFAPGNPGRPRGSRHKTTIAIESLLEGQHAELTQKAISMALAGDVTALRLCLDRLSPAKRDAPIRLDLPDVVTAADTLSASSAVIKSMATGKLTPSEAGSVMAILSAHQRFVETLDLDARLQKLEQQTTVDER